jgi:hypothetical protein
LLHLAQEYGPFFEGVVNVEEGGHKQILTAHLILCLLLLGPVLIRRLLLLPFTDLVGGSRSSKFDKSSGYLPPRPPSVPPEHSV